MELLQDNIILMAGVNLDFDLSSFSSIILTLMFVLKTFCVDTCLENNQRDKKTGQLETLPTSFANRRRQLQV